MKKINYCLLCLLLLAFLTIKVDAKTVKEVGISVDSNHIKEFEFDGSNYETNIYRHGADQCQSGETWASKCYATVNKKYSITYKDAINYYGKKITMKVDVTFIQIKNPSDPLHVNVIYVKENEKNRIGMNAAATGIDAVVYNATSEQRTKIKIDTSFYDSEGKPFNYTGLVGFIDPDGANYLFNTSAVDIFYKDAKNNSEPSMSDMASTAYEVTDSGLIKKNTYGYDNAIFLVSLIGKSSFSFISEVYSDYISVPFLYSLQKEYKINYVLNGGQNDPANPSKYTSGSRIDILNPTREGYEFLGWEEGNVIMPYEYGDKTFTAKWKKIEEPPVVEEPPVEEPPAEVDQPIENPQTGTIGIISFLIALPIIFIVYNYVKRKNSINNI